MEIQVISYDTYQIFPTPLDKEKPTINGQNVDGLKGLHLSSVPVLRIYGKFYTQIGEFENAYPCLVHIHNIFPYLYVPFPAAESWIYSKNGDLSDGNIKVLLDWYTEINAKIADSFKKNKKTKKSKTKQYQSPKVNEADEPNYCSDTSTDENETSPLTSNTSFISDISVVGGIPFYGYHLKHTTFLKISITSPRLLSRLSRLLTEAKIFGKFIQPYESHVPYLLQFLTDYNIYTLKNMKLKEYLFRYPIIYSKNSNTDNFSLLNNLKISKEFEVKLKSYIKPIGNCLNVLNPKSFPRQSKSIFEIDVLSKWIENIGFLVEREVASLKSGESFDGTTQYINSTKSLLDDVENLRTLRGLKTNQILNLGLFDRISRLIKNQEWNDQLELDRLFDRCVSLSESSYNERYRSNAKGIEANLKRDMVLNKAWTSFQSNLRLQYVPDINYNILIKDLKNSDFVNTTDATEQIERDNFVSNELPDSKKPSFQQESEVNINVIADELVPDIAPDITVEDDSNISRNNLTTKLIDASVIEDLSLENAPVSILNKSDLKIFESIHSSAHEPKYTLSQRESTQKINTYNFFNDKTNQEKSFSLNIQQPTDLSKEAFMSTFESDYNMLKIEYDDPYFSKLSNYDSKPFIFAGDKFQLHCSEIESNEYPYLKSKNLISSYSKSNNFLWKYKPKPPTYNQIKSTIGEVDNLNNSNPPSFIFQSQIKGLTQQFKNYKYSSLKAPVERLSQNELLILITEIHVNTRDKKVPDPKLDEIQVIFCNLNIENFLFSEKLEKYSNLSNLFILVNSKNKQIFEALSRQHDFPITVYDTEIDMLEGFASLVEFFDPDIFCGFELHSSSWGYVIERCKVKYGFDFCEKFSRVFNKQNNKVGDAWGYTHASNIKITGRQMLNLWRMLRSELNLNHYSLENIVFHVFHDRIPVYSHDEMTKWWGNDGIPLSYLINYYVTRITYEMELIKSLGLVDKINEQSKLLGIDFYSILYRGGQFMVECLLNRITKSENFILISPSKKQVFKQNSLECIPLVMEPNSAFYKSPLIVLDFQSLYPSLIIAYNICYSTLLGNIKNYDPKKYVKMGVTNYKSPEGLLKYLGKENVNIAPNGCMFAKENIRKSVLAKMLIEILNLRIYIKSTMNELKSDRELNKLYDNRQLALKLLANVTYGYTSATFSGRMPNSDIADAIVSCARETLLKAVQEIEMNSKWGAKVVYGDTDSLFVYLPGKTKENAFKIGKEIADHITSLNPKPVKLKFEKVYLPSILVSKKRYVGWSYDYELQEKPRFDAKGIETVRRDGVRAQQKILEKSITLLFETRDISAIKGYVLKEFYKIITNKVNIKDFFFAKGVRLGTYKNEAYIPPGARVSMKRLRDDHRSKPEYKERIFYIVRKGLNKETLRDRCVSPEEFLDSGEKMQLDSEYYINKVLIPPMERIFNLLGVDVRSWVRELPQLIKYDNIKLGKVRVMSCICCGRQSQLCSKFCESCGKDEVKTLLKMKNHLKKNELKVANYMRFCRSCSSNTLGQNVDADIANKCYNEDCDVYYSRVKAIRKTSDIIALQNEIPDW